MTKRSRRAALRAVGVTVETGAQIRDLIAATKKGMAKNPNLSDAEFRAIISKEVAKGFEINLKSHGADYAVNSLIELIGYALWYVSKPVQTGGGEV